MLMRWLRPAATMKVAALQWTAMLAPTFVIRYSAWASSKY